MWEWAALGFLGRWVEGNRGTQKASQCSGVWRGDDIHEGDLQSKAESCVLSEKDGYEDPSLELRPIL